MTERMLLRFLVLSGLITAQFVLNAQYQPAQAQSPMWNASGFSSQAVRGFNLPTVTPASMAALAGTGANIVRILVNATMNAAGTSYTYELTDVENAISYSKSSGYGYRVVIALQPLTQAGAPDTAFWTNLSLHDRVANIWQEISNRYNGNVAVAGYDILNEPIAPNEQISLLAGQAQWIAFASEIITLIRQQDPNHVIIFEPSPGAIPESYLYMTAPLPFSNIVYSLHDYEPYAITTQGLQGWYNQENYPSPANSDIGAVNISTLSASLAPVEQFAKKFNVPIYVGEFGCIRWAPNNSAYNYVADLISLFESQRWAWTFTSWQSYQGWDPQLPASFFYQFSYVNAAPQVPASIWNDISSYGWYRTNSTDTMQLLQGYFTGNAPVGN